MGAVGVGPSRAVGAQAWTELLRLPALFTVPGDALAGAAAAAAHPNPRTVLAICSSLCLYEAGMALNDWADRQEDAAERPHRPLPSGRIRPTAALAAACAFTGAGLSLAACAGRPALAVATPLAATVWAYDLALKSTPAGPLAMAAARGLDLLLGAAATTGGGTSPGDTGVTAGSARLADGVRRALPSAALLGAHTLAVTTVSRRETQGGSPLAALAALATTGVLTRLLTRPPTSRGTTVPPPGRPERPNRRVRLDLPERNPARSPRPRLSPSAAPRTALAAAYAATAARPYFHAALNPSPPLTQRAVSGGIRAMIPLQAALSARSGATATALLTAVLAPIAKRFARKVSIT
ncbi:prenyltransferase [Streptomyces sp. SA15]|uniref:SCO3242 family prenyltransferase n=1 Tax=Streptomyces sp. SA15 TaxID=934019 RepID=UPI000BAF0A07|nr:UbiA family prenyltransferase [Streptomyces sp. SA15]PAZ17446.1 prenyltransferase [Streptomyces sp. SA15]